MPARLKSRRTFLKDTALTGAALMVGGCQSTSPHGRGSKPEPVTEQRATCWALVADTHIDLAANATERSQNMHDNFRAVVRDVLHRRRTIAGMLIDGDVAHREGAPAAYALASRLVEPIRHAGMPLHVALGNHDDRGHLLDAFHGSRPSSSEVPDKHVEAFRNGPLRMIVLDSLVRPNHAPGRLGGEQLRWLAAKLDVDPGIPTVLFLHHDLRGGGGSLQDSPALMDVITPRRQVKAVFQGHTHTYSCREIEGIHLVELPATAYVFSPDQPLGWVQATFKADSCELQLRVLSNGGFVDGGMRVLHWRVG